MEWEEDVTKHKMRSLPFQKWRKEVKTGEMEKTFSESWLIRKGSKLEQNKESTALGIATVFQNVAEWPDSATKQN